jgi:hypothetical protein
MTTSLVSRLLNGRLWLDYSREMTFASPYDNSSAALRVIDKTTGATIKEEDIGVETVRPVVWVRKSDLASLNIDNGDMEGVTIGIGGVYWIVQRAAPMPNIAGEGDGVVHLILAASTSPAAIPLVVSSAVSGVSSGIGASSGSATVAGAA